MSTPPDNAPLHNPLPDLGRAKRAKRGVKLRRKMGRTKPSPEPDIIPPHLVGALDALEARHAQEAIALARVESLAQLMDAQFAVPFTSIRLGLDTVVGLIPGIGDTISFGVAGYIIWQGKSLGASSGATLQMIFNSFIDWVIGLVPVIGDIFDVGWRSNLRNTALMRQVMEDKWAQERSDIFKDNV